MQNSSRKQDDQGKAATEDGTARALLAIAAELANEVHPGQGIGTSITLDSDLDADLSFDSLTRQEFVHRIENEFNILLGENALGSSETPRDLLREICAASSNTALQEATKPLGTSQIDVAGAQRIPNNAKTLNEVISWHAQTHPDLTHLHLLDNGETARVLTYGELYREAACVAGGLLSLGLEPGFRVILMLPTSRDYFFSFLGTLLAGGVPVPVYPPGRPQQLEEHLRRHVDIAENAGATIMITPQEYQRFSGIMSAHVNSLRLVTTVQDIALTTPPDILPATSPDDTAFLQYTSGSTGNPKGVILSHSNLLANIRAMGQVLEVGPKDVFVSWLPLYHDMGLIGAWLGSLTFGMPLVIMPPLTFLSRPERWLKAIHKYKGTISGAPNFAYELCATRIRDADISGIDLSSWRVAFNGAEIVNPSTLNSFSKRFEHVGFREKSLMPVYGLAENSVGLAFPPLERGPKIDIISRKLLQNRGFANPALETNEPSTMAIPSCGPPLPGHQIRIVDDTGHELGERHQGRVQFLGPSSSSGYFRNPGATQDLFDGKWRDSGDIGYLSEGEIYITGRHKDLIIRAGRNIYPAELETVIGRLDGIQRGNVAIFGSVDPTTGSERLVVMAENRRRKEDQHPSLRRNISAIILDLAGVTPDDIVLLPPRSVPKTSSGKIRRQAARQLYETGQTGGAGATIQWQILRLGVRSVSKRLNQYFVLSGKWLYAIYAWLILIVIALPIWSGVALIPILHLRWLFLKTAICLLRSLTGVSLEVEGTEKIDSTRPVIFSANHTSYLDGAALISAIPTIFGFVVKSELSGHFAPRIFLKRLGCHFVERFDTEKSLHDASQIEESLTNGNSIAYFPEGTFTRMPGLLPFHMGAFTTAINTGTPIQPIAIRGARAVLRDNSGFPRPGNIQVLILSPIYPPENTKHPWQAALLLRDAVRREILSHIREPDLAHEHVFQEILMGQNKDHD